MNQDVIDSMSIDGIYYSSDIWELAEFMHDRYEKIAKKNGWMTQEKSRVPFEDLPKENKKTMLDLAYEIIGKIM